jgi:3-methyladenine DNA glycosylase/8-oxoguanine DNA glycosylase
MNYINPIQYLYQKDSKIAAIIQSIGNYSRITNVNHFESLIHSIISQKLTGKAATAIYTRFLNHYKKILLCQERSDTYVITVL